MGMSAIDYKIFKEQISNFMKEEEVDNFSDAQPEKVISYVCPGCDMEMDEFHKPQFSQRACECCGTKLAGDRHHVTSYNKYKDEIYCYDVCDDCRYYMEYGQLDDQQMLDMANQEIKSCDDIISDITEILIGASGSEIAETYEKVSTNKCEYNGDNLCIVTIKD